VISCAVDKKPTLKKKIKMVEYFMGKTIWLAELNV